jgi:carbonic anhydrase
VETVQRERGTEGSVENLNACVAENVSVMCQALREQSEILAGLEQDGRIVITGGVYNVAKGEVEFVSQP